MATGPSGWQQPVTNAYNKYSREDASDAHTSSASSIGSHLPFPDEASQALPSNIGAEAFPPDVKDILSEPINPEDVEIKPDGNPYLPEIKYRKILLKAFGPGGWCMIPRGPSALTGNVLSREYALLCHGRFVSQARGSTTVPAFSNPALASEAVRSNALMRCCKDLGIASELWDAGFVAAWKENFAQKRTTNDNSGRIKVHWSKKE